MELNLVIEEGIPQASPQREIETVECDGPSSPNTDNNQRSFSNSSSLPATSEIDQITE
jgi:hypothetical protein